jgi:glycine cleavage system aminomethyltransferase T/glycine/D-amino acid oxidase-like deaminating enzyme
MLNQLTGDWALGVKELPAHAHAVIVGGGIVGCSVAYHLTRQGWPNVVVLEQNRLAGGTTWHSAGMIGRLRNSNALTKINKYSADLYSKLEAETGQPTGWKQVGSLIVATTPERMQLLERTAAMSELFGVEVKLITPEEVVGHWPFLRPDDILGGAWLPLDGKLRPDLTTLALAKGAVDRGAKILEHVEVTKILTKNGRAAGVETSLGTIRADIVVLCGGMWTRQFGLQHGINVPLHPVEHHYIVTEPIAGVHDDMPVGRDPDRAIYFRTDGDQIVLGAFQKHSNPWMVDTVKRDFSYQLLEPDWPKYAEPLAAGKWRIPVLEKVTFPVFCNGPESFTPDNHFICGEAPTLPRCFVLAGFNSVGIASAGGAGKVLSDWIVQGEAPSDLWSVDIRRFAPSQNNRTFLRERVAEVLGLHYQMAWPNYEFETARPLRTSPVHDRLAAQGACFGSKMGWERPNWFAPPGVKPETVYSFGRQNWFEYSAAEHRAAREHVAVFDQSAFSKFIFQGPDALATLQRLCGAQMDVPIGRAVYTGMFNDNGGFESDLTVTRLEEDRFYLVSGSAQTMRDFHWIRSHIPPEASAQLHDATASYGVLGVMGPNARKLLAELTDADLSNEAFPFGTAQWISIGRATVLAIRITYVGELGWELHIPVDQTACAYDAIVAAGQKHGLANAGHYAINSLRMEKAYRAWGAELSPEDTPLEAGLSFAIDWAKHHEFLGQDALMQQQQAGVKKRLVLFALDDPQPVLWGSEPIYRDGKAVGYTTSGAYGHTLGRAIAMGYVSHTDPIDTAFIRDGRYELKINGQLFAAKPYLQSPHDPKRTRILA